MVNREKSVKVVKMSNLLTTEKCNLKEDCRQFCGKNENNRTIKNYTRHKFSSVLILDLGITLND